MGITEEEREMLEAYRVLPGEIRGALRSTILSQAEYYQPKLPQSPAPVRLSLVIGGRRS